jgi:hypothetical protein
MLIVAGEGGEVGIGRVATASAAELAPIAAIMAKTRTKPPKITGLKTGGVEQKAQCTFWKSHDSASERLIWETRETLLVICKQLQPKKL